MYTLYKSTNNISGKIFVGIEKDNKIVNMNLNYVSDYESIGSDFFDRVDLKKDILTIEDAYNKRDIVVVHLKGKGHSIYNFIDNDHIDQYGPKDFHETISKKYTFVYVTSNDVNNKLYVGSHTTDRLNDEYIGSGRTFLAEVDKITDYRIKDSLSERLEFNDYKKYIGLDFFLPKYIKDKTYSFNILIKNIQKINDKNNNEIYQTTYFKRTFRSIYFCFIYKC